ncbi:response regulator transcription factor [Planobispora rosea]|nr:response regulator [Planobispora rosea]
MPNILVVEDDTDIRDLIVLQLRQDGHQVRTASSGPEALAAIERQPPDVVILDWGLPYLSGPQVCRRVRAMPEAGRVKVLMLTVQVTDTDMVEGMASGADVFMTKPFDIHELRERVGSLALQSGGAGRGPVAGDSGMP